MHGHTYKAVVSQYLQEGSAVYGCLIDALKAFDTVGHNILFDKLLTRGVPSPVLHFLFGWYQSQHLRIRWNGLNLSKFLMVYNKVALSHQSCLLSI